jgi:hypothetical protein
MIAHRSIDFYPLLHFCSENLIGIDHPCGRHWKYESWTRKVSTGENQCYRTGPVPPLADGEASPYKGNVSIFHDRSEKKLCVLRFFDQISMGPLPTFMMSSESDGAPFNEKNWRFAPVLTTQLCLSREWAPPAHPWFSGYATKLSATCFISKLGIDGVKILSQRS